jgi:hypothetical protein
MTLPPISLIGAAQRVEHYEIAAYTTARNLAFQLRQPAIVQLLTMSLGEEQNAGQLLDQVAQPPCRLRGCLPVSKKNRSYWRNCRVTPSLRRCLRANP